MSKLTASRCILLSIAAPSALVALILGNRPNLTPYQIHLLETASQICYASTTLISLESTRKLIKKPLPPATPPKPPTSEHLPEPTDKENV